MKIGLGGQLWLVDNHFENFHRMLDEMALVGLDGFEICYPFIIEWYESRPEVLKQLLKMHDLEFGSYYTGIGFSHADSRKQGVEEFKRRCRFVANVGTKNVLLDGGDKSWQAEFKSLDDFIKTIAETANELGSYARGLGLTLSWHQHWGSIFEAEAAFHRLMELTDPSLVGFCPDVAQLTLSGFDVVATVKRYAKRITFVHYKDVTFAGRPQGELWPGYQVPTDEGPYGVDSRGRMVELGRGVVPFKEVTQALLDAGYNGWLMDDFDFSGYAAMISAKACKDFINHGLGIWGERDIRHNTNR